MTRQMDERMIDTSDMAQPVDLGCSNGLGFLMRERRRMMLHNGVRGRSVEPAVPARLVRLMAGRGFRRGGMTTNGAQ
jgi:hypothetical protein